MWIEYKGEYDKEFYDIRLKSGDVIKNCWPNAGTFHTPTGVVISGEDVSHVQPSESEPCA